MHRGPFFRGQCRLSFIENPNLVSLANPMVWNLDSWVLSEETSLLFVYVCDAIFTTVNQRRNWIRWIRVRALNRRIHWI